VWQYVAGDRPALARQEFYTAMKLVSLAQVSGRASTLSKQAAETLMLGFSSVVWLCGDIPAQLRKAPVP